MRRLIEGYVIGIGARGADRPRIAERPRNRGGTAREGRLMMPISIERDEVRRLIAEENAQLVEVLPEVDFAQEHITGAINIPLKELDERGPRELDRWSPVIVYCNDYQ